MVFAKARQQRTKSTLLQYVVPALRAVASDVTQSPNRLLPDVVDLRRQQLNELWDSASADNSLGVVSSTRRNICERPGGFELQNTRLEPSIDQFF